MVKRRKTTKLRASRRKRIRKRYAAKPVLFCRHVKVHTKKKRTRKKKRKKTKK